MSAFISAPSGIAHASQIFCSFGRSITSCMYAIFNSGNNSAVSSYSSSWSWPSTITQNLSPGTKSDEATLDVSNIPGGINVIIDWRTVLNPSIWLAAPKSKQSHSRRRHRQIAGKALRDKRNLNHCPVCDAIKLANSICPFCYNKIKRSWKSQGENAEP